MSEPTLATRLATFVTDCGRGIPPEVTASVRQRVLDIVGICLAAGPLPTSRAVAAQVAEDGGAPQATAIGVPGRVPASAAAFLNRVLAHSLDYDDTHLPSVLHPSAAVVPAALAVGEQVGASGPELVNAVAAGLETCVRLGMAGYDPVSGNSVYFEHGQHATSLCGTLGAAAAAALLYRLDAEGVRDALGIAASAAGGVLEGNRMGGTVKRTHCGFAARAGVVAAQLARRGITGPPTVLEGRFGFFQAFLRGEFDQDAVLRGLAEDWSVPGIFVKPYPANHFTHAAIDAALALRAAGLRPADVDSVTVGVAAPTVRTIGEPIAVKRAPATGYQAQFSGPFAVAAALHGGSGLGLGLDDFTDERAADPSRRALAAKISVVADPQCDAIYPHQFPAVLAVSTVDGQRLVRKVLANRGGPGWPLSDDELDVKFRDNAGRVLPLAVVDAVAETIRRLDRLTEVTDLLTPMNPAKTSLTDNAVRPRERE